MGTIDKDISSEAISKSYNKNQRRFPISIVVKDLWHKIPIQIAIFCILFGIPFTIGLFPKSDLFSTSFNDDDPVVEGVITSAIGTEATLGDEEIFEYKYQFILADEKFYTGKGYSTGNTMKRGDEIKILYKQNDPSKSNAVNLRSSMFGGWAVFFGVQFEVFGLIVLLFSLRKPLRQISILKIGEITDAKLLDKKATNVKINKLTVYALTFEFTASNNKIYQEVVRSTNLRGLSDNKLEKLVYKPSNPKKFILVDDLSEVIRNHFLKIIQSR